MGIYMRKPGSSSFMDATFCKLWAQVIYGDYFPCADVMVVTIGRVREILEDGTNIFHSHYAGSSPIYTICSDIQNDQNAIPWESYHNWEHSSNCPYALDDSRYADGSYCDYAPCETEYPDPDCENPDLPVRCGLGWSKAAEFTEEDCDA